MDSDGGGDLSHRPGPEPDRGRPVFHAVTEADLRSNLARASDWPFDVFQLDDGYQPAIGDWLRTNADFPTELDGLAGAVAAEGGEPATVRAWRNTLSRSFLHRRLWLNDPDCLMLRTARTKLTHEQARTWALAVGMSGGMALVSDDLALLDRNARALLDDVVALGREADAFAASRGGHPPRCPDVLDADPPTRLLAAGQELVGQPDRGTAYLQGLLA